MAVSDEDIAGTILELLRPGITICPSQAARALAQDWRPLMDPVRRVARGMEDIEITQNGRVVDPETARGPIRLRLAERG